MVFDSKSLTESFRLLKLFYLLALKLYYFVTLKAYHVVMMRFCIKLISFAFCAKRYTDDKSLFFKKI